MDDQGQRHSGGVTPVVGAPAAVPVMFTSRHDDRGHFLDASTPVTSVLGFRPVDLVGRSIYDLVHPSDRGPVAAASVQALARPDASEVACRLRRSDGSYAHVLAWWNAVDRPLSGSRVLAATFCVGRMPRRHLGDGVEAFGAFAGATTAMVAVLDVDSAAVRFANPCFERRLAAGPGELVGRDFLGLVEPGARAMVVGALGQLLHDDRRASTLSVDLVRPGTMRCRVSAVMQNLSDHDGVGGILLVAHPFGLGEPEAMITWEENPPEGFVDRRALREEIAVLLADSDQVEAGVALVTARIVDSDLVADAFGPECAGAVLWESAQRVSTLFGGTAGSVVQLGVSKLAWVLRGITDIDAARAAGDLVFDQLRRAFMLESGELFITPRVAVVVARHGASAPGLLAASLNAIDRTGPGRPVAAVVSTRGDVALSRLRTRTDMHHAIDRDEFVLHYQPIVEFTSGRVTGTEALIRWAHPHRGLLTPREFLSYAEETGFVVPMGTWVLRRACRQIAEWAACGIDLSVGVNISALQLADPHFARHVLAAVDDHGIRPDRLHLEITETAALDPDRPIAAQLGSVVDAGVKIAIDDFGTGHASLSYLRRVPAQIIKIDQVFVRGLDEDGYEDNAIIEATIRLAHRLGRVVVAEGIETASECEQLVALGSDLGQGYHLGRPQPAAEIPRLLDEQANAPATSVAEPVAWTTRPAADGG